MELLDKYIALIENRKFSIKEENKIVLGEYLVMHDNFVPITFETEINTICKALVISTNSLDSKSLAKLNTFIEKELENQIEFVKDSRVYKFQGDSRVFYTDIEGEVKLIQNFEELDIKILESIEKYWMIKAKTLTDLNNCIIHEDFSTTNNQLPKLELKLSVSDIALLFRLMDEEKLINYKHKTQIYRFISECLSTEKQENISDSSIKNKFLSPDSTAIKNIEYLLVNLKIALKKIQ